MQMKKNRRDSEKGRGPKGSVRFDSARLKSARTEADLTQAELASTIGVNIDSIRRAERGAYVSQKTALDISAGLGRNVRDLLAHEDDRSTIVLRMANSKSEPELVVRVYGSGHEDPSLIPTEAWLCYEALFPIAAERNDPVDIINWLTIERNYDSEWRSLFFTLSRGGECIGVAYIPIYEPLSWGFGSYFGISREWRAHGLARHFLRCVAEKCESVAANLKGILFEVEPFGEDHLQSAIHKLSTASTTKKKPSLTQDERSSIRAALRIAVYTGRALGTETSSQASRSKSAPARLPGALSIVVKKCNGYEFFDYIQPAIRLPLSAVNEVKMWLMVYPFKRTLEAMKTGIVPDIEYRLTHDEIEDILQMIYGEIFSSAYVREYKGGIAASTYLEGYGEYLARVRSQVTKNCQGTDVFFLNRDMVPRIGRTILLLYTKQIEDAGIML